MSIISLLPFVKSAQLAVRPLPPKVHWEIQLFARQHNATAVESISEPCQHQIRPTSKATESPSAKITGHGQNSENNRLTKLVPQEFT